MTDVREIVKDTDYEYGFHDDIDYAYQTGKGISEKIVREISAAKNEPQWMLDYRLAAYHAYLKMPEPSFGPD